MSVFNLNNKFSQWTILLLLAFTWGSSFILMKRGLEVYDHFLVAALRISLTFIFLAPFAFFYLKKVKKKYWKYLLFSGLFGNGIPAFLFTIAQTNISSSLSGMLNSLTPIFALIVGLLIFKQTVKKQQIIGVFIGLLGALSLILSNGLALNNAEVGYSFYVILATICYAFSLNVIKIYLKEINPIAITALSFLTIGPWAIIYVLNSNFTTIIQTNENGFEALFYIAILALFGTAISVILFNTLLKKTTTLFAASVTYLIPAFAILWGVLDGESINTYHIIGIITVLFGIFFINHK